MDGVCSDVFCFSFPHDVGGPQHKHQQTRIDSDALNSWFRERDQRRHILTHSYYCEFAECGDHSHAAAAVAAAATTIRATNCHRLTHHFPGPDHVMMIL